MLRACRMKLEAAAPAIQQRLFHVISQRVQVSPHAARFVVEQSKQGATIPFLARYRRDETGNLNEDILQKLVDISEEVFEVHRRREAMIKNLRERGMLTDELRERLERIVHLSHLEDAWEPFKVRKSSLAQRGRDAGLEPLVHRLLHSTEPIDVEGELHRVEDGSKLAQAIVVEEVQRCEEVRLAVLAEFRKSGRLTCSLVTSARKKVAKEMTDKAFDSLREHFNAYDGRVYSFARISAHGVLALYRGEAKGALRLSFEPSNSAHGAFMSWARSTFSGLQRDPKNGSHNDRQALKFLRICMENAYTHVVKSAETTIRRDLKKSAESEAIIVFAHNLRQLLLKRPLRGARLLAMDPGLRHGVKCVALDESGTVLTYFNCKLHEEEVMMEYVAKCVQRLSLNKIVIGNGTASRETADVVAKTIDKFKLDAEFAIVSEVGASVYSISDAAKEEFPTLDPIYRSAVSIGRRVLDPLGELVKVPVRSMGIGMYQHDVNERELVTALHRVVESCVANVGVNATSSNKYVIEKVPGLTRPLVSEIVNLRKAKKLNTRAELRMIPYMTEAIYQQVAGFLRFPNSNEPLDNTNIHPESYNLAKLILQRFGGNSVNGAGGSAAQRRAAGEAVEAYPDKQALAKEIGCGVETMMLVARELKAPALDPRSELPNVGVFRKAPREVSTLSQGDVLSGVVQNVTTFGAFVDCGLHCNVLIREGALGQVEPGSILTDIVFRGLDNRGRPQVTWNPTGSQSNRDAAGRAANGAAAGGLRMEFEDFVSANKNGSVETNAAMMESTGSGPETIMADLSAVRRERRNQFLYRGGKESAVASDSRKRERSVSVDTPPQSETHSFLGSEDADTDHDANELSQKPRRGNLKAGRAAPPEASMERGYDSDEAAPKRRRAEEPGSHSTHSPQLARVSVRPGEMIGDEKPWWPRSHVTTDPNDLNEVANKPQPQEREVIDVDAESENDDAGAGVAAQQHETSSQIRELTPPPPLSQSSARPHVPRSNVNHTKPESKPIASAVKRHAPTPASSKRTTSSAKKSALTSLKPAKAVAASASKTSKTAKTATATAVVKRTATTGATTSSSSTSPRVAVKPQTPSVPIRKSAAPPPSNSRGTSGPTPPGAQKKPAAATSTPVYIDDGSFQI